MTFVLSLLIAVAAMISHDAVVEFLTIAEVKGRAKLSSALAPLSTLTGFIVTAAGVGPIINHGVTVKSATIVAALLVTDALDGYVFTRMGKRISNEPHSRSQTLR